MEFPILVSLAIASYAEEEETEPETSRQRTDLKRADEPMSSTVGQRPGD